MTKFSVLLMAVTFIFFIEAAAVPTKRQAGLITLPFRSLHGHVSKDIHPQLYLQHHINRADRRLARMIGRAMPSDGELRARLHKRMHVINRIIYHGRGTSDASSRESPSNVRRSPSNAITAATLPLAANLSALDILAADAGYVALVQIGTPPAKFRILMDTGSADFWVGSEQCKLLNQSDLMTGESCGQHQFLGSNSSSTFVDTQKPFNMTFAVGFVAGTIVRDTVTMAGLVLTNHSFGAVDLETSYFSGNDIDGVMGLGRTSMYISAMNVSTPIEALFAQGLIPAPIASFKISRLADQKFDGEVTLGGLDQTKFDPTTLVTIANNNPLGYWQAPIDAITVNGQEIGLKGFSAILDTGVPFINMPLANATAIHDLISGSLSDGQGGFTLPCTTTASVALTFGSQIFTIDSRDLAWVPVDPRNLTGTCISGIVGTDTATHIGLGSHLWVLGDVFLKNAYFSTDSSRNTISLAKQV